MSITITIDGKICECEAGEYLLDVARRNKVTIPSLCGSKSSLRGRGCCRVCIVEVIEKGRSKVVASCIYPIEGECEVSTNSERIVQQRAMIFALLNRLAPDAKIITSMAKAFKAPDLERLEPNAEGGTCILCGLCVEACDALGTGAIAAMRRGIDKEIDTAYSAPASACIGCKSCANVCPTDTIAVDEDDARLIIWDQSFELAHCEVCGEVLGTVASLEHAAKIADVEPVYLCFEHRRVRTADALAKTYAP